MAKSKPKPSLKSVAKRYVKLWQGGIHKDCEHVLDQLGGYCGGQSGVEAEIEYAEVAAVTALMMIDRRMTAKDRDELSDRLFQVTRNL